MKNKVLTIGIIAFVVLFLSGCGGSQTVDDNVQNVDGWTAQTVHFDVEGRDIVCITVNPYRMSCDWGN